MGTWGHGYFEDDAALDFMIDVEEAAHPKELLQNVIETALNADYLESDEGVAVIVAAAYIDREINGTRFTPSGVDYPLDVDSFPDRHPQIKLSELRFDAIHALQRVLDEGSEINELWAENEEDYPAWREGIEQLIGRLQK